MKSATCHPEKKHYCKGLCEACYMREFRRSRPEYREYMRNYSKAYREANPDKIAVHTEKRRSDPEKRLRDAANRRNSAYLQKYGLTIKGVESLLAGQGGKCAICEVALDAKTLNVDHCHVSGDVRGVLCGGCNTGLGLLGDDITGLRKALKYLMDSVK